jgi:hypothetical protein
MPVVPRAGIEPATRGFSVLAYLFQIKGLAAHALENFAIDIRRILARGKPIIPSWPTIATSITAPSANSEMSEPTPS